MIMMHAQSLTWYVNIFSTSTISILNKTCLSSQTFIIISLPCSVELTQETIPEQIQTTYRPKPFTSALYYTKFQYLV